MQKEGIVMLFDGLVYKKSEYYAATHTPFHTVKRDLGLWGEYQTYRRLCALPGEKKFLFNCYLPKAEGGTAEVDLILLHGSGVYVFESKNYSGWIFGSEAQQDWTQCFPNRHKAHFFNPIMQNNAHIRRLLWCLPGLQPWCVQSVIVFGERCVLRKIQLNSNQHMVIQRNQLPQALAALSRRQALTSGDMATIYQ
jgi:hypothetical protein